MGEFALAELHCVIAGNCNVCYLQIKCYFHNQSNVLQIQVVVFVLVYLLLFQTKLVNNV